jgi:hypothetical protein
MPFITREIDVLKKHFRVQPKYILSKELMFIIIGLVKKYDINSKQFLSAIQNYIKPNSIAIHFLHELNTYARSFTQSLAEYDAKCVYYTLNFTERVDMTLYRKYENANIVSTHVCTLPTKLTGGVDEILKSFEETIEVIEIDDDDDDVFIIPSWPSPSLTYRSGNSNTSTRDSEEFEIYGDDENNNNTLHIDDDDEHSSFCEEISESSRPSPVCICLSSDDERPSTSAKRKRSLSVELVESSSDYDRPTTSKLAIKKMKGEEMKVIVIDDSSSDSSDSI